LWDAHVIDTVRCGHSLNAADLDADGQPEIVVGEHDRVRPYRSRSRTLIYKKADPKGRSWYRSPIDDRFEQHVGAQIIKLSDGLPGIISHGWVDERYVHLWRRTAFSDGGREDMPKYENKWDRRSVV
jgi:hypothetical protein